MFYSSEDKLVKSVAAMVLLLIVSVPLAIWKAIDICIWLYTHVSITW